MKDFDKLFDELFGDEYEEIEAELDKLDAEEAESEDDDADSEAAESRVTESDDRESTTARNFYEDDDFDDDLEDTEVGGSIEASCPYCGEAVDIFADPAGGSVQDYVEDCSVCCQPMMVRVRFVAGGQADVSVSTTGG